MKLPIMTYLNRDEKANTYTVVYEFEGIYYQTIFQDVVAFVCLPNEMINEEDSVFENDEYFVELTNSKYLDECRFVPNFSDDSKHYAIKSENCVINVICNKTPIVNKKVSIDK